LAANEVALAIKFGFQVFDCDVKDVFVSFGLDEGCLQILNLSFGFHTCIFFHWRIKFKAFLCVLSMLLPTLESIWSVSIYQGIIVFLDNLLGCIVIKAAILAG